ncbi:MAG: iron-sulfur cluster assembly accessory protein, partial [Hyphomicrobiales bacterium]|nr:iron-sulfur cluster assembly accessory protein [Hyphomicrobiales bacterium]
MTQMRPRPKVMTLTDTAATRVREIMAGFDKEIAGLRVGVKNAGCAGMEYTLDYAETADPLDDIVEDHGVKLFIDPKAVLFLLGTEMDYKVDKLSSG